MGQDAWCTLVVLVVIVGFLQLVKGQSALAFLVILPVEIGDNVRIQSPRPSSNIESDAIFAPINKQLIEHSQGQVNPHYDQQKFAFQEVFYVSGSLDSCKVFDLTLKFLKLKVIHKDVYLNQNI